MYILGTEYNSTVYPISKSHCMKKLLYQTDYFAHLFAAWK